MWNEYESSLSFSENQQSSQFSKLASVWLEFMFLQLSKCRIIDKVVGSPGHINLILPPALSNGHK